MTYYCKRHRDKNTYTWEGPDEAGDTLDGRGGFHEHHRKVHGGTKKAERLLGVLDASEAP